MRTDEPEIVTELIFRKLSRSRGSVPLKYSWRLEIPSPSGSSPASAASNGFKPLAISQSSGIPSPSVSPLAGGSLGPGFGAAAIQLVGSFPYPRRLTRCNDCPAPSALVDQG